MTLTPVPPADHAPAYPGFRERRGLTDLVVTLFALPASASLCALLLLAAAPAPAHAAEGKTLPGTPATERDAARPAPPPCRGRLIAPPPCLGKIAAPQTIDFDPPCRGDVMPPPVRPGTVPCLGSIPPPPRPEPPPPCSGAMPVPCAGVPIPHPPPPSLAPARIDAVAPDPGRFLGQPVDLLGRLERDGDAPDRYAIVAERAGGGKRITLRLALTLPAARVAAAGLRVGGPVRARGTLKTVDGKDGATRYTLSGARLTPGN